MRLFDFEFARAQRWPRTVMMARLGTIAATLSGIAVAFNLGGQDGYTIPISALLGAPFNGLLLALVHWLRPSFQIDITSNAAAPHWSVYHLLFCGAIAVSWTFWGFLYDLSNPADPAPLGLSAPDAKTLATPMSVEHSAIRIDEGHVSR
jgi:hypothetical protein